MFMDENLQNNKANLDVRNIIGSLNKWYGWRCYGILSKKLIKLCLPFQIVSSLEKGKNLIEG